VIGEGRQRSLRLHCGQGAAADETPGERAVWGRTQAQGGEHLGHLERRAHLGDQDAAHTPAAGGQGAVPGHEDEGLGLGASQKL